MMGAVTTPPPEPPQQPQQPSWPPPQQQPPPPPPWQQPPPPQPWQQQQWQHQPQPGYAYPAYGPGYPQVRPTSSKATTVLVLGIVAIATFFTFCGLGVFAAIAALVMAPGARREIEASGGMLEGDGKIKAGVILSWVTVGLTVLGVVIVVVVVAIAASTTSDASTAVHAAGAGVTLVTSG